MFKLSIETYDINILNANIFFLQVRIFNKIKHALEALYNKYIYKKYITAY